MNDQRPLARGDVVKGPPVADGARVDLKIEGLKQLIGPLNDLGKSAGHRDIL
jgi:hypothetical protein